MNDHTSTATYVGHVERDPEGTLWAVLYFGETVLEREQVPSLRKAKRRVYDLVLSAADNYPSGPCGPLVSHRPNPAPPKTGANSVTPEHNPLLPAEAFA